MCKLMGFSGLDWVIDCREREREEEGKVELVNVDEMIKCSGKTE